MRCRPVRSLIKGQEVHCGLAPIKWSTRTTASLTPSSKYQLSSVFFVIQCIWTGVMGLLVTYNPNLSTMLLKAYLKQGAALDSAVLMSWFDARKEGEWLKEGDRYGDTPLCLALNNNAPEAVALAMIAACPDAVKLMNMYCNTPLHIALANKAPEAVTTALFEAWPDAAKEKDRNGDTPLYLALKNEAPEAVVTALRAASSEEASEAVTMATIACSRSVQQCR